MDGSMAHTEHWRSYLTEMELPGTGQSSNDQDELAHLLNNPQPDVEAGEYAASTGKKRRGRKPTLTPDERKTKKHVSDRNYRRGHKDKFDRLMKIASECGGIAKMESDFLTLRQMKSRYGGFEEIDSKLNKLEQMEAESAVFEKEKTMFDGIHNNVPGLDRLMKIASECGGIEKMESDFQRLELMKSRYGGFEEIDSKLNKLEKMEAESAVFDKVKTMFGGIHNIVPGLDRLKKTEFQHTVFKPNQTERPFIDSLAASLDFLQDQYNHGAQPVNSHNQGSTGVSDLMGVHEVSQWFLATETPYSDVHVTNFIANLEENTKSRVNSSSFKDLDGERQRVGNYSFPMSLVSTVNTIMDAHGDVTENSLFNHSVVENTCVLLCAAIKEMGDLSLKQVTEEIMVNWRDAIKDASRIGCNVEFAWKHLEAIAYAYFGLKARNYRTSLELRMANLMADEESLRQELERKVEEVKDVKAKEKDLTSLQCQMCQDCADRFLDKNVGLFG
ncbi:hypothetical protein CRYUN_Cryun11dG0116600 [Craigia yunnanensis]